MQKNFPIDHFQVIFKTIPRSFTSYHLQQETLFLLVCLMVTDLLQALIE